MARVANKVWQTEDGQYTVTADLENRVVVFGKSVLPERETVDLIEALTAALNDIRN